MYMGIFQSGTPARHPVTVVARCPFKDGIREPVSWLTILKKKSIIRLQVRTKTLLLASYYLYMNEKLGDCIKVLDVSSIHSSL